MPARVSSPPCTWQPWRAAPRAAHSSSSWGPASTTGSMSSSASATHAPASRRCSSPPPPVISPRWSSSSSTRPRWTPASPRTTCTCTSVALLLCTWQRGGTIGACASCSAVPEPTRSQP
eukprot:5683369-Prymnesium_polylepis.1